MICLAVAGLGLMSSTNGIGYWFLRFTAATLVRFASVISVLLLIIAISEPVGHLSGLIFAGRGLMFAGCVGCLMILIWMCSYKRGLNVLIWICSYNLQGW
jgi:hypothetical protein